LPPLGIQWRISLSLINSLQLFQVVKLAYSECAVSSGSALCASPALVAEFPCTGAKHHRTICSIYFQFASDSVLRSCLMNFHCLSRTDIQSSQKVRCCLRSTQIQVSRYTVRDERVETCKKYALCHK
jgi:hypothetical protein